MGTLTITTTSQQDERIAAAFGRQLHLTDAQGAPRDADSAEVKAAITDYIRQVVLYQERVAAIDAIRSDDFSPG